MCSTSLRGARSSATCCPASGSRRPSSWFRSRTMLNPRTIRFGTALTVALAGAMGLAAGLEAQEVKITDPRSVVMIVDRDSNDIAFMDIKTHRMIGKTFLGNNVNPHMVMMSPDGRYVVTGGTRANKAYIIDTRTLQLV